MNHELFAEPAVIRVTPYGFAKYAKDFLDAPRTGPGSTGFSPVPYYLVCRSLELGLKAFILAKGAGLDELRKKLGHDLTKTLARADAVGLAEIVTMSSDDRSELARANEYYKGKGFEYFEVYRAGGGYPLLPDLLVLEKMAARLVTAVTPVCLECA